MLHAYFQQKNMNPFADSLEKPVKELMDLNMKALQSFSYLKPNEMLLMRRPEEMMEKNLEVLIENSHTALAYMQNMFDIMEKHWLKSYETTMKSAKDLSGMTKSTVHTTHTNASTKTTTSASTKAKPTAIKAKSMAAKTKPVAAKATTSMAAKKSTPSKSTSSVKKQPVKHSSSTTSTTSKPHGTTSEVKHVSNTPHHLSSNSSHAKPMMKELDLHKKI